MACNNNNNKSVADLILLVLVLVSASANAVAGLNVTGNLCCTPNLACPGAALSGAEVKLSCTNISGGTTTAAETVTAADGTFNTVTPQLLSQLTSTSGPIPCNVSVQYPSGATGANCPLLAARGSVVLTGAAHADELAYHFTFN